MERLFGFSRILASGAPAPTCTVTVNVAGGGAATIYADDLAAPTPKANPFQADSTGFWFFYAPNGRYDVVFSGTGIPVPYTLADVPTGTGDAGVVSLAQAGLPADGAAHTGRLFLLTDQQQGIWVSTGAGIVPILDYAFRSFATAGLPAAGVAGRVRRITDGLQGLAVDDGAAWTALLAYAFPASTKAGLPAPSLAGRVRRVSDATRGLWVDTATRWFGLSGEVANVVEFGAIRDGATDDLASIQAAINALSSGGVVIFPPGSYAISGPILVPDGVTLRGFGASIVATAGFAGDSMIRTSRRDDNIPANEDRIRVENLVLTAPAAPAAGFSCLDLTGATNSLVSGVRLLGPGSGLNGVALRLADQNPTASSNKKCSHNLILLLYTSNWSRFLTYAQAVDGRCDHNAILSHRVDTVRTGVDFSGIAVGVPRLLLASGVWIGDGNVASKAVNPGATYPRRVVFLQVDLGSGTFTDTGSFPAEVHFNEAIAFGASGTTSVAPLAQGGTLAQSFLASAYLKISSGTALAAGANAFVYTLPAAPAGATFLLAAVSGLPATPISWQASLSGMTLTVTIVAASPVILTTDFVFRAIQIGP